MGREVKRVALDFDWPMKKIWSGYLNEFYDASSACPHCGGKGNSPEAQYLSDMWYGYAPFHPFQRGSVPMKPTDEGVWAFATRNVERSSEFYGKGDHAIMQEAMRLSSMWNTQWQHHLNADDVAALLASERLHDLTHTWEQGKGWQKIDPPVIPTPTEVNRWSIQGGMGGHDGINQWVCVRAECERNGWKSQCDHCDGEGRIWPSAEAKQAYEDWEGTEPPAGDGWQMWETTSEGSPMSPVFSEPEQLAHWLADTKASTFGGSTASYETWLNMIKGTGWAPSAVMIDGKMMSGVEAL